MCVVLLSHMIMHRICVLPKEARREHQKNWNLYDILLVF